MPQKEFFKIYNSVCFPFLKLLLIFYLEIVIYKTVLSDTPHQPHTNLDLYEESEGLLPLHVLNSLTLLV